MARQQRRPLAEHIDELRTRLGWCVLALIIGSALGYWWQATLLQILVSPLAEKLYYTSPGGGFSLIIQICLGFGVVVTIPVFIFHLLRFVGPALPRQSGRFVGTILAASCVLVAAGISFAYFVSLPASLHFLKEFSTDQVQALITTDTYMSFVTLYLAGFALLFQLPLLLLVINSLTPLPPRTLLKQVRWVILISFVAAAILTPTPDPMNQAIMAVPIIVLYLVSVVLIWAVNRKVKFSGSRDDMLVNLREQLMDLSHAKLVARQRAAAADGRTGMLCEWEDKRWGKLRRKLVTFEHEGRHELVRMEKK